MISVPKVIRNVIICHNFKLDVSLLIYNKGFHFPSTKKKQGISFIREEIYLHLNLENTNHGTYY